MVILVAAGNAGRYASLADYLWQQLRAFGNRHIDTERQQSINQSITNLSLDEKRLCCPSGQTRCDWPSKTIDATVENEARDSIPRHKPKTNEPHF
jgi:hypothetical protein